MGSVRMIACAMRATAAVAALSVMVVLALLCSSATTVVARDAVDSSAADSSSSAASVLERTAAGLHAQATTEWAGHPWNRKGHATHRWKPTDGAEKLARDWIAADPRLSVAGKTTVDPRVMLPIARDALQRPTTAEFFPQPGGDGTQNTLQWYVKIMTGGAENDKPKKPKKAAGAPFKKPKVGDDQSLEAGHICGAVICGAAKPPGKGDDTPVPGLWANVNPTNFFPQSKGSNHGRYYQMEKAVAELLDYKECTTTAFDALGTGGLLVHIDFAYTHPALIAGAPGATGADYYVAGPPHSHYTVFPSLNCWKAALDDLLARGGNVPHLPFLVHKALTAGGGGGGGGAYHVDRPWGNADPSGIDAADPENRPYDEPEARQLLARVRDDVHARDTYTADTAALVAAVATVGCTAKRAELKARNDAAAAVSGATYAAVAANAAPLVMAPVCAALQAAYATADSRCTEVETALATAHTAKQQLDLVHATAASRCKSISPGVYVRGRQTIRDAAKVADDSGTAFAVAYDTFKTKWNALLLQRPHFTGLAAPFSAGLPSQPLAPPSPSPSVPLTHRLTAHLRRLRKQQKLQAKEHASVSHEGFPILKMQRKRATKKQH